MKKMKKIAIKSSLFAFFLTLLADVIMFVVTVSVIDASSGLTHIVIHHSRIEGAEPPAPEEVPYFLSHFIPYLLLGSFIFLYFPPTFFAYINRVRARRRILLANIFLGWTIVGWFVCFFWAFSLNRDSRPDRDSDRDERSQKAEQE